MRLESQTACHSRCSVLPQSAPQKKRNHENHNLWIKTDDKVPSHSCWAVADVIHGGTGALEVLWPFNSLAEPGIRPPRAQPLAEPFRQFFHADGEPLKLKAGDFHDSTSAARNQNASANVPVGVKRMNRHRISPMKYPVYGPSSSSHCSFEQDLRSSTCAGLNHSLARASGY
jgi:hypothetical protein